MNLRHAAILFALSLALPAASRLAADPAVLACPPCEDQDACTVDVCDEGTGQCVHVPTICEDDDLCTIDLCDPSSGACVHPPAPDGTACSDRIVCTTGDACSAGRCAGTRRDCDDGDACTEESCDETTGNCLRSPAPDGTGCDDGEACTAGDACAAGRCVGAPVACDDGDGCTVDTCEGPDGACRHTSVACVDPSGCTIGACDSARGSCRFAPVGAARACDDGSACTRDDTCRDGACLGDVVTCDDGDPCTIDACGPAAGCVHTPRPCGDADPCTRDACDPGTGLCRSTPMRPRSECDDGFQCTVNDRCLKTPGSPRLFCRGEPTPGAACELQCSMTGRCEPYQAADGVRYYCSITGGGCADDGDACTRELCDFETGQCRTFALECDDGNACTRDSCDPTTGPPCRHEPTVPGAACDDANACTVSDTCRATATGFRCQGTPTVGAACDDASACTHDDRCAEDGVVGARCLGTSSACADRDACTSETCDPETGVCVISRVLCVGFDVCLGARCDPVEGCVYTSLDGEACDDGLPCTIDDTCRDFGCGGTPLSCDDGDPCSVDSCDSVTGTCLHDRTRPCPRPRGGFTPTPGRDVGRLSR